MRTTAERRRSADTEFTVSDAVRLFWRDLTEAGSLKLREVLKYCARGESVLWRTEFDGDAFWRRSGQIIPSFFLEARVSPRRVHIQSAAEITHHRRFGKQLDSDGRVARLVSEADSVITGAGGDGEAFDVARLLNLGFFVRRDAPAERRRVKRLHPALNVTAVPKRTVVVPTVADLRTPPAGWSPVPMAGRFGLVQDAEPQLWLYSDTDPNGHVHAMSYVARVEEFVMGALGRREIPISRYYPHGARVLFRRPCHNGEVYFRSGRFYRAPARDAYLFVGAFHRQQPGAGGAESAHRPAALVQFEVARRPERAPAAP